MKLTIAGKERELKFGIGFVRKLDEIYYMDQSGIKFGAGLNLAIPQLSLESPTVLANVIRAAVKGNVSQQQVDEALEDYADEHDGLDGLFEFVDAGLKTSSITKGSYNRLMETMEEAEQTN